MHIRIITTMAYSNKLFAIFRSVMNTRTKKEAPKGASFLVRQGLELI